MARYKMIIAYDGSRFSGWQAQKNAKTVAGAINETLSALYKQSVSVYGSGRTDSGVHAIGQVAHCDLDSTPSLNDINKALSHGIRIRSLEKADARFHARHHATARSYVYQLSTIKPLFVNKYVWSVDKDISLTSLQKGLHEVQGFHDFASFSAQKDSSVSTEVHLYNASFERYEDGIILRFVGSHFLRSMVRRLVGTLVAMSCDEITYEQLQNCLNTVSPIPSRFTAPPDGLFLENVWYTKPIEVPVTIEPPLSSSWKKIY